MKTKLFTESSTCYEFTSLSKALVWCAQNQIESFIAITFYPNTQQVSVFNPFLAGRKCYEVVESEAEALKYVGSFL